MANGLLMHLDSSSILSSVISPHDVNSAFLFFLSFLTHMGLERFIQDAWNPSTYYK